MKRTLYTLPIAGAGPLSIVATTACRRVEIYEDDSAVNQGLVAKFPEDNFTQAYTIAPTHEPIVLGSHLRNQQAKGNVFAYPIQKDVSQTVTLRPADILIKLTSATATVTKVRVEEYE